MSKYIQIYIACMIKQYKKDKEIYILSALYCMCNTENSDQSQHVLWLVQITVEKDRKVSAQPQNLWMAFRQQTINLQITSGKVYGADQMRIPRTIFSQNAGN